MNESINQEHLEALRQSAISGAVITARGYRTISDEGELEGLGFARSQCRVPGLLLPLHATDGGNSLYVYRPDHPRVIEQKKRPKNSDGTYPCKVIKYEYPKHMPMRIDCPPPCQPRLKDPSIPLWITEGQKKADSLASIDQCAIALLGVWNFKGKNEWGGNTVLADFDYIALNGRDVRIVFDSDVRTKPAVRQALDRLAEHLQRKQAHVSVVYLPPSREGQKQGVDHYLAAGHRLADLEALIESPHALPQPAAPVFELLDTEPASIRRPLALINGRGYAATWLSVKKTVMESTNRRHEIVKHDPPLVHTGRELFIVRNDGVIFGPNGDKAFEDLGLEVHLPEIPPIEKLWSTRGVKAFHAGVRPSPADVFERVAKVVDRFIDFARSLADQSTMAQMVACYILATWFLDAFNVMGFLWPNGDRGSGKTQFLTIIAELAYLGQVILGGGSYACLRDLADYGATLAFDDAENLADPKRTDPDKRALLLAGNRRGNTVPVKELASDKVWRTRYVNTFCPRLFSATRLPDPILASRTIVVPLIRTPERYRANADPSEHELWPHDRRALMDDLWALALAHLHELPHYAALVNERSRLTGRNLEPWRALLAVALWLDGKGLAGLFAKMESLAVAYQTERADLDTGDLIALVIQSLCELAGCANGANQANGANPTGTPHAWVFETSRIAEQVAQIAKEQETGQEADYLTTKRVGMALHKMRLVKVSRPGGRGTRKWKVSLSDLARWSASYGVALPDELAKLQNTSPLPEVGMVGPLGAVGTEKREVMEL